MVRWRSKMKVLRCPKLAVNPYANIGDSSDAVYNSNYFERKFADIPIILGVPTSFRYLKIAKLKKTRESLFTFWLRSSFNFTTF